MTHILLEGYNLSEPWLFDTLRAYIKPHHKAAVIPFAFRDSRVRCAEDWDLLYGKENGKYYGGITAGFWQNEKKRCMRPNVWKEPFWWITEK